MQAFPWFIHRPIYSIYSYSYFDFRSMDFNHANEFFRCELPLHLNIAVIFHPCCLIYYLQWLQFIHSSQISYLCILLFCKKIKQKGLVSCSFAASAPLWEDNTYSIFQFNSIFRVNSIVHFYCHRSIELCVVTEFSCPNAIIDFAPVFNKQWLIEIHSEPLLSLFIMAHIRWFNPYKWYY